MAVLPSGERDTEAPCCAAPTAPVPTSLPPCGVQTPPFRVNTHAAPAFKASNGPPTRAVLPSAERDTEAPCCAAPTAPVPTSLPPCGVQTPTPLRVKTHTAPAVAASNGPPTRAVLPSAERDTEVPCCALPAEPPPTSLGPCGVQTPPFRVNTHAAPT